ncbi:TPA: hypothetical protein KD020_003740 [Vibrio parahaemolyticus]|nr:hypothetical protein [Vibrio parahaemolyticus]HBN6296748.1 hypothetical protein [Vibrio parahaemolyticus]
MSIQQRLRDLVQELWTTPKEQRSRSYDELDPKIAPLVLSLNQFNDVVTIASCQGHAAGRQEAPYVYFHAPLPFVQRFVTEIRQAHLDDRFHHAWKIIGEFNDQNQLTFTLSSPYLDNHYLRKSLLHLAWYRERIDHDIATLTQIVNQRIKGALE